MSRRRLTKANPSSSILSETQFNVQIPPGVLPGGTSSRSQAGRHRSAGQLAGPSLTAALDALEDHDDPARWTRLSTATARDFAEWWEKATSAH